MHHSLNSCYSYFSFIISCMFFLLFLFFIFTLFFRDLFLFILGSSSYSSLRQYSPFSAPSPLSLHSYFSFLLSVYFSYLTLSRHFLFPYFLFQVSSTAVRQRLSSSWIGQSLGLRDNNIRGWASSDGSPTAISGLNMLWQIERSLINL